MPTRKPICYLAGPIAGLSYDAAVDWREWAGKRLRLAGVEPRSPMRGKGALRGFTRLEPDHGIDGPLYAPKAIVGRDRNDVLQADVLLVNLVGATRVSIGTMVELGWADALRKPAVVVMEDDNRHRHPFVTEIAFHVTPDLREGLAIVLSLLGGAQEV